MSTPRLFIAVSLAFCFLLPAQVRGADAHVLVCELKLDGKEPIGGADIQHGTKLRSIQVEQRLDAPDYFSVDFQILGTGDEQNLKLLDDLKAGAKIEVIGLDAGEGCERFHVKRQDVKEGERGSTLTVKGKDPDRRFSRDAWRKVVTIRSEGSRESK